MKNMPRLLIFAVVAGIFICLSAVLKRETFTGENGTGYGVGLQVPALGLVVAGVLLVGILVYRLVKRERE
jgi:hypothetical protein